MTLISSVDASYLTLMNTDLFSEGISCKACAITLRTTAVCRTLTDIRLHNRLHKRYVSTDEMRGSQCVWRFLMKVKQPIKSRLAFTNSKMAQYSTGSIPT